MAASIAKLIMLARNLGNGDVGYGQGNKERWQFINRKTMELDLTKTMCDCSSSTAGLFAMAGWPIPLNGTVYTGNLCKLFKDTGYFKVLNFKSISQFKPGDAPITPGHHVAIVLDKGQMLSAQANEKGKTTGGKAGDQTGKEVVVRKVYNRPGGWKYIIRPYTAEEFERMLLNAFASSGQTSTDKLNKLNVRAPYDGPLWATFMNMMTSLHAGVQLNYSASTLSDVPQAGHVFVVLGAGLKSDGTMPQKFIRRLQLAKDALNMYPNSEVLITGGKPQHGITEGEAGMTWLVNQGIAPSRILTEEKAASTIGNAKYSMPMLQKNKFSYYTLISDASHMRRASALFDAAQLGIETASNKQMGLKRLRGLAFKDTAASEGPASAATRKEIVKEVIALLGL